MTSDDKVLVWVVSGPGREFDEYWFHHGPEEAMDAVYLFACEWIEEALNDPWLEPGKVGVEIEVREVTREEADFLLIESQLDPRHGKLVDKPLDWSMLSPFVDERRYTR